MTIYAKCLIASLSAILLVNVPSDNEKPIVSDNATHDVEKLITLTKIDIRQLENKIDSAIISKGDSLMLKKINNGATSIK